MEVDFELTGLSDTETDPGTEKMRQFALPCYAHIQDSDGDEDQCRNRDVEDSSSFYPKTPSLSGSPKVCPASNPPEDIPSQPDPLGQLVPPGPSGESVGSSKSATPACQEDLERLAAEVARLAKENELLKQRFVEQAAMQQGSGMMPISGQAMRMRPQQKQLQFSQHDGQGTIWFPMNYPVEFCTIGSPQHPYGATSCSSMQDQSQRKLRNTKLGKLPRPTERQLAQPLQPGSLLPGSVVFADSSDGEVSNGHSKSKKERGVKQELNSMKKSIQMV